MNFPLEDFQGVSRELDRFDIPSGYRLPTLNEWKNIFQEVNEISDIHIRTLRMKEIRENYGLLHGNYYRTSTSRGDKHQIYGIELSSAGRRERKFNTNYNTGRVRLIPLGPFLFI